MALSDHGPLPSDRHSDRAVRRRIMPPPDVALLLVSMECQHINRKFSWVRTTGQRHWVCPTCAAAWHLIPLDASEVYHKGGERALEVAYHVGSQTKFGQPEECDHCRVEWNLHHCRTSCPSFPPYELPVGN